MIKQTQNVKYKWNMKTETQMKDATVCLSGTGGL